MATPKETHNITFLIPPEVDNWTPPLKNIDDFRLGLHEVCMWQEENTPPLKVFIYNKLYLQNYIYNFIHYRFPNVITLKLINLLINTKIQTQDVKQIQM